MQSLNFTVKFLGLLLVTFLGVACGQRHGTVNITGSALVGKEVVEWQIPKKAPQWINKEVFLEGDKLFFIGMVDKKKREDFARTDAMERARIGFVRNLASRIVSEYDVERTSDDIETVKEVVKNFSEATIRGGVPIEWYIVRYHIEAKKGLIVDGPYYRVYVKMAISVSDFQISKKNALKENFKEGSPTEKEILKGLEEKLSQGTWPYFVSK